MPLDDSNLYDVIASSDLVGVTADFAQPPDGGLSAPEYIQFGSPLISGAQLPDLASEVATSADADLLGALGSSAEASLSIATSAAVAPITLPTTADTLTFDFPATTSVTIEPYWSYPQSDPYGLNWGPSISARGVAIGDLNGDGLNDIVVFPTYANIPVVTNPVLFINEGNGNWTENVINLPTSQPQAVTAAFIFQWNGQSYLFASDSGWDDGIGADAKGSENLLWQWNKSTQSFQDDTFLLPNNIAAFNHVSWAGNVYSNGEFDVLVPRLGNGNLAGAGVEWYAFVNGSNTVEDLTAYLPPDIQYRTNRIGYITGIGGDIQQGIGTLAVADLNGDGKQDIVTVGYGNDINGSFATLQIFAGVGVDSFSNNPIIIQAPAFVQNPANGFIGGSKVIAADIEGIGRPDLIVLWEGAGTSYIQILHNNGNLSFTDITNAILPDGPIYRTAANGSAPLSTISVSDLTGDGFPDLVLSMNGADATSLSSNSQDFIYVNEGGQALVPYQFSNLNAAELSSLSLNSAISEVGSLGSPVIAALAAGATPSLIAITPATGSPVALNGFEFSPYYSLTITPSLLNGQQYMSWNQSSVSGTRLNESLALYGVGAQGTATAVNSLQITFSTVIQIDCYGLIPSGQTSFSLSINGSAVGAATIQPNSTAQFVTEGGAYTEEVFQFALPSLVEIDSMTLSFETQTRVNDVTVNGVALTQDTYTASGASPVEQNIGSTFYNAGDVIALDASPWNTQLTAADQVGSASNPIQVNGGGGSDVVDLLGNPSAYTISGIGTNTVTVSESEGLNQNAVLKNIAYLAFADGIVVSTSTGQWSVDTSASTAVTYTSDYKQFISSGKIEAVYITDTAANVGANIDGLAGLANAGELGTITLTDAVLPTLSMSQSAYAADVGALNDIVSPFKLSVALSGSGGALTGLGGHFTTAVFSGPSGLYSVSLSAAGIATVSGSGLSATLTGVQAAQFSDGAWVFSETSQRDLLVYELYQAAFDRIPDEAGYLYWAHVADTTSTTGLQFADAFLAAPEFAQLYGANPTNLQYITELYTNVLGRAPDQAGLDYWVAQANAGQPRDQLLIAFATSPENVNLIGSHVSNGYWTLQ